MSFFDGLKQGIKNHFDKKKEEQEMINRLKREAEAHRAILFEQEYRTASKQVALAQAKKDAAKKSGLQKLRAENRLRNLKSGDGPKEGSFFGRLADYTQKNLAKREENLKKTEALRDTAKKEREKKLAEQKIFREQRLAQRNIPLRTNSTWQRK